MENMEDTEYFEYMTINSAWTAFFRVVDLFTEEGDYDRFPEEKKHCDKLMYAVRRCLHREGCFEDLEDDVVVDELSGAIFDRFFSLYVEMVEKEREGEAPLFKNTYDKDGLFHSYNDEPAMNLEDVRVWFEHGSQHRPLHLGPAVIRSDGRTYHYLNDKFIPHEGQLDNRDEYVCVE